MIVPFELSLLVVGFLGGMGIINLVRARKEREYYFSSLISFFVVGIWILFLLEQILLGLVFFCIIGMMSVWRLPKVNRIVDRGLRQIDVSSPLRARDFLGYTGWVKLANIWGVRKVACVYFFFALTCIGGFSYILHARYVFVTIWFVVPFTIASSTSVTLIFYQQLKRGIEIVKK